MASKTIQVRSFSEALHDRILVEMAKRKMTLAQILEAAIREYLKKGNNGNKGKKEGR